MVTSIHIYTHNMKGKYMSALIMLKRNSSLVWNYLNNKAVLIEPRNGYVHVLNESGTAIWSALEAYKTKDELIEMLINKYTSISDKEKGDIMHDVEQFINKLLLKELVVEVEL